MSLIDNMQVQCFFMPFLDKLLIITFDWIVELFHIMHYSK